MSVLLLSKPTFIEISFWGTDDGKWSTIVGCCRQRRDRLKAKNEARLQQAECNTPVGRWQVVVLILSPASTKHYLTDIFLATNIYPPPKKVAKNSLVRTKGQSWKAKQISEVAFFRQIISRILLNQKNQDLGFVQTTLARLQREKIELNLFLLPLDMTDFLSKFVTKTTIKRLTTNRGHCITNRNKALLRVNPWKPHICIVWF